MVLPKSYGLSKGWPYGPGQGGPLASSTPVAPTLAALGLSALTFTEGAAAGTVIGAITGKTAGSALSITPSDSRVAIDGSNNLVVGLSASSAGNFGITIRETLTGAANTPRDTAFTLTVSASAGVGPLAPYLGQVATRSFIPNGASATHKQANGRTAHIARQDITSLQVAYAGWWVDTASNGVETNVSGAITIEAAVEYNGAIVGTVWSAGSPGSIPAGSTLTSAAVTLSQTIPSGATFFLRSFMTMAASGVPYNTTGGNGNFAAGLGDCYESAATGLSSRAQSTGTFTSTSSFLQAPCIIVATTTWPTFYCLGDSKTNGNSDTANAAGDAGELCRSIGPSYAYINGGTGGDRATWWYHNRRRRMYLTTFCSHILSNLSINDLGSAYGNESAALFQANLKNLWGQFGGKPIAHTTISPSASGSFSTLGGQTVDTNEAAIQAANTYLRTVPAPLFANPDTASYFESSTDPGKWNVPGFTADGIHPSPTAYAGLQSSGIVNPTTLAAGTAVSSLWSPYSLMPLNLASLYGSWLSAQDPSSATDATGAVWSNKNSRVDYLQGTSTRRPVLTAGAINGLPAYRFASANNQFVAGGSGTLEAAAFDGILIATVINPAANAATQIVVFFSTNASAGNPRVTLGTLGSGGSPAYAPRVVARRADADGGNTAQSATGLTVGTPYILLGRVDCLTGEVELRVNGAQVATTTLSGTVGPWVGTPQAHNIGARSTTLDPYNGDLGEVICIPGQFTLSQMQKVEGRLAYEWGITLPGGHPYAGGPPMT